MVPTKRKPQWWQLYIGLPLLCGLFVFEINMHLNQTDNTILQLAILGLIFVFMRMWLRSNRGALLELDERAPERREQWGVQVYQFPAAERITEARVQTIRRRSLESPEGEIKGVLDTTFEMDAEEPDSLFQPRADQPRSEDVLHLEPVHSKAHKD
jgi:hypothetical protein